MRIGFEQSVLSFTHIPTVPHTAGIGRRQKLPPIPALHIHWFPLTAAEDYSCPPSVGFARPHPHLRQSAQPRGAEDGLYPIASTLIRATIGLWINIVRHVGRRRPCKQGYDSRPRQPHETSMQNDMQGRLLKETSPHKRRRCVLRLTHLSKFPEIQFPV